MAPRFPRGILGALAIYLAIAGSGTPSSVRDEVRRLVEHGERSRTLRVAGEPLDSGPVLRAFYERRDFSPAWTEPRAAAALLAALRGAEADGLDSRRYHLEVLAAEGRVGAELRVTGELDLVRTDALLRLAHDLRFGRVDPSSLEPRRDTTGPWDGTEAVATLEALVAAADLESALAALRPDHYAYRGLREALARYRSIRAARGWPLLRPSAALRQGTSDASVVVLRDRLRITGDLPPAADAASSAFDAELESAVRRFQHRHGLNEDGVVGPATRAALNVPVAKRLDQIRVNLERGRWILRGLPDSFVAVNIAGQRLYVVEQDSVAWETRVIVGKALTRTPVFSTQLQAVLLNPAWTVPRGIAREIVAQARRDPAYLRREGMRMLGHDGRAIDPAAIDFGAPGAGTAYQFRQDPGPHNALGRIKFVSPNPYNVYLHDTPQRALFEREQRTFSHGCIRVQDPLRLAVLLLDEPARWSAEAIAAAIDTGATRTIHLERALPLLILYWTAATDLHQELHFYPDVYDRDAAVLRALDQW